MARVNTALRELWGDDPAKARASLMNFVIYSEDPERLERNTATLAALTREHACRALLILNIPDAPDAATRAWITAHCQLYDGKQSVCCEQLSFVISGGSSNQVRSTVFANLDSDLPLILWWQGDLNERLDDRFLSEIDGLIIDSRGFPDAARSLRHIIDVRDGPSSNLATSDLAWMRSHFMRTALAGECQSPHVLHNLENMDSLRITYAAGHRTSAFMLAAWIGLQLRCRLGAGMTFRRAAGKDIRIAFVETSGGCALQAVELSGEGLAVAVRRAPESCFSHAILDHPEHQHDHVRPGDPGDDASLIGEQLSRLGGETRYFEMLPLLLDMLKQPVEPRG